MTIRQSAVFKQVILLITSFHINPDAFLRYFPFRKKFNRIPVNFPIVYDIKIIICRSIFKKMEQLKGVIWTFHFPGKKPRAIIILLSTFGQGGR